MSTWDWIKVASIGGWVLVLFLVVAFTCRYKKVANPSVPPPEKHMVTDADLVRMFDDLDAHLTAHAGDPR